LGRQDLPRSAAAGDAQEPKRQLNRMINLSYVALCVPSTEEDPADHAAMRDGSITQSS
jgi:hypothetical protein